MSEIQESANARLNQQLQWCLQMFEALQENSLSVSALNEETLTSPDIMDSNVDCRKSNRRTYIDWPTSRDDAVDNDVIAKNIDNDRDSNQWKKTKKQFLDNRKLSFNIFGRSDKKPKGEYPRDSVVSQDESSLDRRPKRYFSQQNLKSVPVDEAGCEGVSPRFKPTKFLWRLVPNQRFKSNQDLTRNDVPLGCESSSSLNLQDALDIPGGVQQTQVNCVLAEGTGNPWPGHPAGNTTASCPASNWNGAIQRQNRCQSLSEIPTSIESLPAAYPNNSYSFHRQRPDILGHEFSSTRCLGDYRPGLNTHYEEPAAGICGENEKLRSLDGKGQNRWSMQALNSTQESSGFYGKTLEPRLHYRVPSDELTPQWPNGIARSTSMNECFEEQDVDSSSKCYWEGKIESSPVTTSNGYSDFCSVSKEEQHERVPTALPYDSQNYLPVKEAVTKEENSQLERETHATTMRRLSQEFYSDHTQKKNHSHPNNLLSFREQHVLNKYVEQRNFMSGYPTYCVKQPTSSKFSTLSTRSHLNEASHTGTPSPIRPFHGKSLSMSHLQPNAHTGGPQSFFRNGLSSTPTYSTRTNVEIETEDYDLTKQEHFQFLDCKKELKPIAPGVYHQRGGSLDSSEAGRVAQERNLAMSFASVPRKICAVDEDRVFSDPETVASIKRLSCDVSELPFRSEFYDRQISNDDLLRERSDSTSRQMQQQQTMVSLFQKLRFLRQQKNSSFATDCSDPRFRTQAFSKSEQSMKTAEPSVGSLDNYNDLPQPIARSIFESNIKPQNVVQTDGTVNQDGEKFGKYGHDVRTGDTSGIVINGDGQKSSTDSDFKLSLQVSADISTKPVDIQLKQTSDVHVATTHNARPEVLSEQRTVCSARDSTAQKIPRQLRPEEKIPLMSTKSFVRSPSPPSLPPPLPPKSYRPMQNSVVSRTHRDDVRASIGDDSAPDVGDFYVDRLRREAQKLSKSSGSMSSSSASNRLSQTSYVEGAGLDQVNADNVFDSIEGISDHRTTRKDIVENEFASPSNRSPEINFIHRAEKSRYFGEVVKTEERSIPIKSLAVCESYQQDSLQNGNTDLNRNDSLKKENQNHPFNESNKNVTGVSVEGTVQSHLEMDIRPEIIKDHGSDIRYSKSKSSLCLLDRTAGDKGDANDAETLPDDNVKCLTNCQQALRHTSSKPARTTLAGTNSSLAQGQQLGYLSHILKNLSAEETSSTDEESFRSLSAILCRRLKGTDQELCRVLRPAYVKAGAKFVRRVFESEWSPDGDASFQSVVDFRSDEILKPMNTSDEPKQDYKVLNESLKTLKDELLVLVEKRLKRQIEKNEQLQQRHEQTLLLENKVTETIRTKVDSKQFEKFLSYLEQLEKVVQLFLNLSSRLSNVEEALCQQHQGTPSDEKEQKRLIDKRQQILLRMKEAMDLKNTIDTRSQQVFAQLGEHLAPNEFDDFRSLVRNRFHVLIEKQAIADDRQLILLQKRALTERCQRKTAHHSVESNGAGLQSQKIYA